MLHLIKIIPKDKQWRTQNLHQRKQRLKCINYVITHQGSPLPPPPPHLHSPVRIPSSISNSTFPFTSFKIGNWTIKMKSSTSLSVLFVEDLMVIGTAGSYISSLFQKTANFGKKLRKYSPQFNLHLFKAVLYALGQSKSFGMCAKCHVIEFALPSSSLTQESCGGR